MPAITRLSIVLVLLTLPPLSGCTPTHERTDEAVGVGASAVASPIKSDPDLRVVEEAWPNGSRKVQKTVIETSDGNVLNHGTYIKWHTNGLKEYEATYSNGELHGVETSWHKNGQRRAEAHYDHGLRHGTLSSWDTQGRLRKEENYFNDKPHGTWTIWTAEGKVKWQTRFEHGVVAKK